MLTAALVLGLVAGFGLPAHAAGAAQVELRIWPAGQGRIEVTQNGAAVPVTHNGETLTVCDFVTILDSSECRAEVTAGQPVTLTAVAEPTLTDAQKAALKGLPDFPASQVAFVRWSRGDCGTQQACTFTPDAADDQSWTTAVFTPLQLEVGINGQGKVAVDGGTLACNDNTNPANPDLGFGATTCHGAFAADTSLVLVATPAVQGASITWGSGCEPENGNAASARCTVTMSNIRTFASVGFGGSDPPGFPFQITPRIRVKATGSGQGKITGNGIDCGTQCSADVGYQTRVTLKAEPAQGSSFVRWLGICSTDTTCTFAAGSATYVEARFETQSSTTTSTTTATTTTSSTTTTATALTSRLVGIKVAKSGRRRTVVVTLLLNRRALVALRLRRRGRTVAARTVTAPARRSALRLPVPAAAPAGLYGLTVSVTAGGNHRRITTSLRIRR